MLWMILAELATARAADIFLVARGQAEFWADPSIASFYRTGALMGGAGVVVDIVGPISADLDVAYKRANPALNPDDETSRFEVVPVTLLAEYNFPFANVPVRPYAGLGFAMVSFAERHPALPDGRTVTRGTRPAIELRAGFRVDLGLVPESLIKPSPIQSIELEVFGGRRMEAPGGKGFDLSAWRAGLGVGVRL
ncbi:MAG: hypothetical protein AAF211_09950 [Myxococcota bacterium]